MKPMLRTIALAGSGAALSALLLSGCGSASGSGNQGPKGDRGTPVTLVHLSDGTPCAVMDGSGEELDCGWHAPKGTPDAHPKGYRGTPVTEVRLSDGTRCAVMDGNKEAVDCDWPGKV